MTTDVRIPEELSARVPAEQRGPGLDLHADERPQSGRYAASALVEER